MTVFAFFVLHHLGDGMLAGLAEIDRVLKPQGKVVYAEISRRGAIKDFLRGSRSYSLVHARRETARRSGYGGRSRSCLDAIPW